MSIVIEIHKQDQIQELEPIHRIHTGKCIRRFAGIYAYCRYFIDRKWSILVSILYRKTCHMPKGLELDHF